MRGPPHVPPEHAAGVTGPLVVDPFVVDSLVVDDRAVGRLRRRADFLHVGKGRRWHGKALTVQANMSRRASDGEPPEGPPRIGFTLTKKVGCAVVRNRARRRLREAVRLSGQLPVRPGHDYVVVGRIEAIRLPFGALQRELVRAVAAVHETAGRDVGRTRRGGPGAKSAGRTDPSGVERTRPKS